MGQSPSDADGSEECSRTASSGRFAARLLTGHLLAYPLCFVVAVAAMPISIVMQAEALENLALQMRAKGTVEHWLVEHIGLSIPDAARFHHLMSPIFWLTVIVFSWVHLAAWRWGKTQTVKTRSFAIQMAIAFGATAMVGLLGWGYILVGA